MKRVARIRTDRGLGRRGWPADAVSGLDPKPGTGEDRVVPQAENVPAVPTVKRPREGR